MNSPEHSSLLDSGYADNQLLLDLDPKAIPSLSQPLEPCLEKVGMRKLRGRNELMVRCVYCLSRPFPYHKRISSHFRTQRHRDQLLARHEPIPPLTQKENIRRSFYPLAKPGAGWPRPQPLFEELDDDGSDDAPPLPLLSSPPGGVSPPQGTPDPALAVARDPPPAAAPPASIINKLIPSRGGEKEEVACLVKHPACAIPDGACALFQGVVAATNPAYCSPKALVVYSPAVHEYLGGLGMSGAFAQVLDFTVDVAVVTGDRAALLSEGVDGATLQYTYEASKVKKEHDELLFSLLTPLPDLPFGSDLLGEGAPANGGSHADMATDSPAPPVLPTQVLEATNSNGRGLLHLAALCSLNKEIALLLAHSKRHVNTPDAFGCTPLIYAAFTYNTEAVRRLLEAGADPSMRDYGGHSARDWAAQRGHFFPREHEQLMHSLLNIASVDALSPADHLLPVAPLSTWLPPLAVPPSQAPSLRSSTSSSVASTPRSVGSVAGTSSTASVRSAANSMQFDAAELAELMAHMGHSEVIELADPKGVASLSYTEPFASSSLPGGALQQPSLIVASAAALSTKSPRIDPLVPSSVAASPPVDPHLAAMDQMLRQMSTRDGPTKSSVVSSGPGRPPSRTEHAPQGPDTRKLSSGSSSSHCAACGEAVVGRGITALGKNFHIPHFVCGGCRTPLGSSPFLEHSGEAFCANCYWSRFAPRCHQCGQPIKDGRVCTAGKRAYHPDHFACAGCGTGLAGPGRRYKEWQEDPFCLDCFAERERTILQGARTCGRCKQPIFGEHLTVGGLDVHPEHYSCEGCRRPFTNGNCHEYDGKLYCEEDYRKLLKNICFGCRKPIAGRSITAMGRVWHPEHFVCAKCFQPFPDSNFFEHASKPYCQVCFASTFAQQCAGCERPIIGSAFFALGKYWHKEHFNCSICSGSLAGHRFHEWEGKGVCQSCFGRLPADIRSAIAKRNRAMLRS